MSSGDPNSPQLLLGGIDASVTPAGVGRQEIVANVDIAAATSRVRLALLATDQKCDPDVWDLRRYIDPDFAKPQKPDVALIPIVLIHGIQLGQRTCDSVKAYDPTAKLPSPEVWSRLAPQLNAFPGYQVWIFRYPSLERIE